MSSSKNGEKRTVNSVGKTHFGKWYLSSTSEKEDRWRKDVVDDDLGTILWDSWIMLIRENIDARSGVYKFRLQFAGDARWLKEHYESIYKTVPDFDNVQSAKDHVNHFLFKLNKLIVFI